MNDDARLIERANAARKAVNVGEFDDAECESSTRAKQIKHALVWNPLEAAAIALPMLTGVGEWVATASVAWQWATTTIGFAVSVFLPAAVRRMEPLRTVGDQALRLQVSFRTWYTPVAWLERLEHAGILALMWASGRREQAVVLAAMWCVMMIRMTDVRKAIREKILAAT